ALQVGHRVAERRCCRVGDAAVGEAGCAAGQHVGELLRAAEAERRGAVDRQPERPLVEVADARGVHGPGALAVPGTGGTAVRSPAHSGFVSLAISALTMSCEVSPP